MSGPSGVGVPRAQPRGCSLPRRRGLGQTGRMQAFAMDVLVAVLHVLSPGVLGSGGAVDNSATGMLAVVAIAAAVILASALVTAVVSRAAGFRPRRTPVVDGIRAPRSARPGWARPDAPGRRLPRAPGVAPAA